MSARISLKQDLLRQLEADIDEVLNDARQLDRTGKTARQELLKTILTALPTFLSELSPPALRRADYFRELALAIIECPDLSFFDDERIGFSLSRIPAFALHHKQTLLERAAEPEVNDPQELKRILNNLNQLIETSIAVLPPNDLDWA